MWRMLQLLPKSQSRGILDTLDLPARPLRHLGSDAMATDRSGPRRSQWRPSGRASVHRTLSPGRLQLADRIVLRKMPGHFPLSSSSFSGDLFGARFFVIKDLSHSCIGLVGSRWRASFVFIENLHILRQLQGFLPTTGAEQGWGSPQLQHFSDRLWDIDLSLCTHFLLNQRHGKQRGKVIRQTWTQFSGMQRRWQRHLEICLDVVPCFGQFHRITGNRCKSSPRSARTKSTMHHMQHIHPKRLKRKNSRQYSSTLVFQECHVQCMGVWFWMASSTLETLLKHWPLPLD